MFLVTSLTLAAAACNDAVPFGPRDGELSAVIRAGDAPADVTVPAGARADTVTVGGSTSLADRLAMDSTSDFGRGRTQRPRWTSSHPNVATVDANGVASAVGPGVTRVIARYSGRASESLWVVVVPKVATPIAPPGALPPIRPDSAGAVPAPAPAPAPEPAPAPAPAGSVAELPRVRVNSAYVAPTGLTIRVGSGGDLQAALDAARHGDEIVLAAGARFVGNYVLPDKGTGSGWVTVRSSGTLPSERTRVSPSHAAGMAKILTANSAPALKTAVRTQGWRLLGLEVSATPEVQQNYALLALGDASSAQSDLASVPSRIVVDRSYIHGSATLELRRCIALNSAHTAIVDSYLADCHEHGFDSQAIWGWNGPGPFRIENNYLEAGHEVVGFGGSDPSIQGLVPSDIEIRRNHITRPMAWQGKWDIKNLIEFKAGQRVLIEDNVIENNWVSAQNGFAFVLWSNNQDGAAPWTVTQDMTIRYNRILNVAGAFNLASKAANAAIPMRRIDISHNVITGVGSPALGGNGRVYQVLGNVADLRIDHNTGFGTAHDLLMLRHDWDGGAQPRNLIFTNNVTGAEYTLFSPTGQGAAGLQWAPAALVRGNVFVGPSAMAITMPEGNVSTATTSSVRLGTDAGMLADSPYRYRATDRQNPGADVEELNRRLAGISQ